MIQVAVIDTPKAERLARALCNHFARKTKAHFEEGKGLIQFGDGTCELLATPDTLTLVAQAESAESLARVERVVKDHLLRFTPDEPLEVAWADRP